MEQIATNTGSSAWLIDLLWKHKWLILLASLGAGILSYGASLLLPNKYESTAIVYAAGLDPDHQMQMKEGNALLLMGFLESNFLRESVINEMQLADHYKIDNTNAEGKAALQSKYAANVHFSRTLNKSIEISVTDEDPEFAAALANSIVLTANKVKQQIIRQSTAENLRAIEDNYRKKQQEVDSIRHMLINLKGQSIDKEVMQLQKSLKERNEGIRSIQGNLKDIREEFKSYNLNQHLDQLQSEYSTSQARYISESAKLKIYEQSLSAKDSLLLRTRANTEGLLQKTEQIKKDLDRVSTQSASYNEFVNSLALQISLRDDLERRILAKLSTFEPEVNNLEYVHLSERYASELLRLNDLKKRFEEAKSSYEQPVLAAYLISDAQAEYNPAYPKRLLYAFSGAALMFFFVLGVLLLSDQISHKRI